MRIPEKAWIREEAYEGLYYFAQVLEEMLWNGTRDSYRVPALNTFHRLEEIIRSFDEVREAELSDDIIEPMFEELVHFGARDEVIQNDLRSEWLEFRLHFDSSPVGRDKISAKIAAVRFLHRHISSYLRKCREQIERRLDEACNKKGEFRNLAECFCSFVINAGHSPSFIYFVTIRQFFDTELTRPPKRELQAFFEAFPCRRSSFRVFMEVSAELAFGLSDDESVIIQPPRPTAVTANSWNRLKLDGTSRRAEFHSVDAFDPVHARAQCEVALAGFRAVTYTARQDAEMTWGPTVIVLSSAGSPSFLNEPLDPLKRRQRLPQGEANRLVAARRHAMSGNILGERDVNRLRNSITGFANAFHSESPATQLVTLWLSLEGLLPAPSPGRPRINSFIQHLLMSQRKSYIRNLFH